MRRLADAERIRALLRALGRATSNPVRLYLVGGATAVLQGWRETTIDVDIEVVPDSDELLRALPALKQSLDINIELAAPHHFIPEVPGWRERSSFVEAHGTLQVYHYDPYSQALAKLERGHAQDLADVESMAGVGWVEGPRLLELFETIEPHLYRYPAVDPRSFRLAVERFVAAR